MITQVLNQSVVIFSQNYLPITRINIKRAIAMWVSSIAESLDFNNGSCWPLRSTSLVLYMSQQITLRMISQKRLWKVPPMKQKEVLKRDHHCCQYCGSTKRLILDNLIRSSKDRKHIWEYVVTACEKCNVFKGSHTLIEAEMKLLHQPKIPIHLIIAFAKQFWRERQHKL